ncbi:sodium:proton antiporter [Halonatronum saccharophilum]|uniref:sodium:proton antiporter n=1 Tax=Halonatronum saccharophilum TaxID=150060 RepID=UPI0004873087|nr:cation:proton antiporter subunit C [Halonatronum saccharophilum]
MNSIYAVVGILICIGFYTILTKTNLIKMVIGINIIESAVILLLVALSYKPGGSAPILDKGYELVVDPIPQALALTAIVIGASTTAMMLALIIKIFSKHHTLDVREIRNLRG